ncbi:MAG: P-II family nitrogen regulator [Planctomycetota bacterium]
MKEIKAIIKPDLLEKVVHELRSHADLPGATICEVSAFGRERASDTTKGQSATLGGFGYQRMIKLEIVVPDHIADSVRDLIATHARTGQPGDGLVFSIPVESGVRIRSGKPLDGSP